MLKYITTILFVLMLGTAMGQSGTPDEARKKQNEQLNRKELREKRDLARHYYRNQEYNKAIAILDKIYWQDPSHINYIYFLNSLIGVSDFDKAEKLVKHHIKRNPNRTKYQVDLGYVYMTNNKTLKAKKIYDDIIENLPRDKFTIRSVASAFKAKRQNDYALKAYRKGRELFNDPYLFGIYIGRLYDRMGKFEKMFDEYLRLLTADQQKVQQVKYQLQNSLEDDPDNEKSNYFRKALLKKVQQEPDVRVYSEMLLWLFIQQKDFDMALRHTKALDRRFNLGGHKVYSLGKVSMNNNEYAIAKDAFSFTMKQAPKKSGLYHQAKTHYLDARFQELDNKIDPSAKALAELEEEYQSTLQELGYNRLTYDMIQNLAHLQAFYLHKQDRAVELLRKSIEMPGIPDKNVAQSKIQLADILLFKGDQWEATLLLSQVEKDFKNEPTGHEAKYKNAKLSYYIGEFEWAKGKFDVLKSATSKVISNDAMEMSLFLQNNLSEDSTHKAMKMYAKADLLIYQNKFDSALAKFDSINSHYPTHSLSDEMLFKKAEIKEKKNQYTLADSLYQKVYENYSGELLADNAIMRSAEINENILNNKEKAAGLYEKILKEYPGSLFTKEARKRFRKLRGDKQDGESKETPGTAFLN
mgnify:CR=1 FL=1